MTEREKVFDAFRNCITEPKCKDCPWDSCGEIDHKVFEIPKDLALAVMRELAAQEPRVMTYDELKAISGTDVTVYVEHRTKIYYNETAFVSVEKVYGENVTFHGQKSIFGHAKKDYGKGWRCWTSRPGEERRRDTPWEKDDTAPKMDGRPDDGNDS